MKLLQEGAAEPSQTAWQLASHTTQNRQLLSIFLFLVGTELDLAAPTQETLCMSL